MPWCINQVQKISLTIFRLILQSRRLSLNGNAAFFFNIHRIKHLGRHFALLQTAAILNKAVSQSRFAVVNMGNNGKVTDIFHAFFKMVLNVGKTGYYILIYECIFNKSKAFRQPENLEVFY